VLNDPRVFHPRSSMSGFRALFRPHPKGEGVRRVLEAFDSKDGSMDQDGVVTRHEFLRAGGGDWPALLRELDGSGDQVISGADAAPVPGEEALALAALLARPYVARPRPAAPPPGARADPAASIGRGRELFLARCAACHGERGDGNGPASPFFAERRPRNLLRGEFKWRSTAPPDPPLDEDLFGTIRNGLGPFMPPFPELTDAQVRDLVEFVKSLHPLWDSARADWDPEFPPRPIRIGPPPFPFTVESAEIGEKVYVEFGCAGCHGLRGRGDGVSAPDCRGTLGEIVRPTDLTRDALRLGSGAPDIVRFLHTGLQATAMPSYASNFPYSRRAPPAEAPWRLAHHVLKLAGVPFDPAAPAGGQGGAAAGKHD
jgi:mono/diheme cytochrome c family protein